ncbi:hypothetical protein SUGI_0921720 [Cryptomeria japonica]|uniref:aromatic aminotransferase ISS1 isoform X1 n=1 Tax=Cryptomeria japonica TaxID=3369 RepID=UPI00241482EC|nr:aromatic aminotransferase ISS1 isoform X1 [Cryptomeria japonica]GLJ44169.1 hypothetical protein SUGI_0921720 [Cryptomeria japonica]
MASISNLSRRALETDTPVMIYMQQLLRGATGCMSLAQGVVYWQPPEPALEKVKDAIKEPSTSNYGPDDGLPQLRQALVEKLRRENNLSKSSVMVTQGANQAFVNLVLTLCDPGDSVVMFVPYYFNAYMSFQMTGITNIITGPCNIETLQPDADWLEERLSRKGNESVPKLVTIVNPGNPSGSYVPDPLLQRISELCKNAGSWLVVDNTYEYFMYDGLKHTCVEGPHVVNVFSFSKAYGMMGWRVGYIAYPSEVEGLGAQLLKVQDNIPICASIIGQKLALYSLEAGPEWVRERVQNLIKNREILLDALSPLGSSAIKGGQGAIYLWAKLPNNSDDYEVVRWLVERHGVLVVPGSASGGHGYIRVSFGGLVEDVCKVAAARLKQGLEELVNNGMVLN